MVSTIGYIGILLIIFLETGLFFGFFLPGDSLLFAAGLLASRHVFDIRFLLPAAFVTAIVGYQLGYWIGKHLGRWLMKREDSFWFKKKYIDQAHDFYKKHGGKALIIGRLLPIIRTFVPIVAGMVKMSRQRYFLYNVIGAVVWVIGITLLGYWLGNVVPGIEHYILPVIIAIVLLSIFPALWRFAKAFLLRRK